MKRDSTKFCLLMMILFSCFAANLYFGSVSIPIATVTSILSGHGEHTPELYIVMQSRLPMALAAMLAGSALSMSGLMLQSAFRNPLAGPSVFGISSGASLGVAVVMLMLGGSVSLGSIGNTGGGPVMIGAFIGAMGITMCMLFLSSIIRNTLMLLIVGLMIGYLSSSLIMILNFFATAEGVQGYVIWGMGTFNGVSLSQIPTMALLTALGLLLAFFTMKPLNILLLGERYAMNLGIRIGRVRALLLLSTGILTAVATAYCGPVGFIGLAVPHLARLMFPTDNHRTLMPAVVIAGAITALICNLLCVLPTHSVLPLNAVTPLIGAPIVIWVIFSGRKQ